MKVAFDVYFKKFKQKVNIFVLGLRGSSLSKLKPTDPRLLPVRILLKGAILEILGSKNTKTVIHSFSDYYNMMHIIEAKFYMSHSDD